MSCSASPAAATKTWRLSLPADAPLFPRAANGRLELVPYLMAGYPDRHRSIENGRRMAGAGVAALEIGIPFSDPLADGPVIQKAGQAALEGGLTVGGAIEIAAAISGRAALVFMSYINPILAYGPDRFAADASSAGVAALIVPDLPVEEAEALKPVFRQAGLDTVFLVAPTSTDERIQRICAASTGFVYCVTLTGITGVRADLPAGLDALLGRVRARTELPVAAGFGISRPEHIAALIGHADAAVVGSALVAADDPLPLVEELLAACG